MYVFAMIASSIGHLKVLYAEDVCGWSNSALGCWVDGGLIQSQCWHQRGFKLLVNGDLRGPTACGGGPFCACPHAHPYMLLLTLCLLVLLCSPINRPCGMMCRCTGSDHYTVYALLDKIIQRAECLLSACRKGRDPKLE